ncbi:MAG: HlyD family efflux transporter periplasmic adaptor subunit [Verrucomicrobiales bacterium]|nr:HlyD family efflux transporter periplasmic adaptor subunit [Verrucomicrobiales bacterium]MCP5527883.1 HlyD family efflux transporter periplasmic adaptor subunit [Verrucomicrobiales bacterium]
MSHAPVIEAANEVDPLPLLDREAPLPCAARTRMPVRLRSLSFLLLALFLGLVLGVMILPWQQFVRGAGRVIAYDPLERSVTVEAPLAGRVERAAVVEGQLVKEDELLFKLTDNDPNLLQNLEQQREAARIREEAAAEKIRSLTAQIEEQERALPLAIEAAQQRLEVAQYAEATARLQHDRIKALFEDERGLVSRRDYELATLERDRTAADTLQARANLKRVEADLRGSINSSGASLQTARSDLAAAQQAVSSLNIQINQAGTQKVLAPRDGIVYRVHATEGTFLKAGSPLCTLIPETESRMVELFMDGNDMPLIRPRETDAEGRIVREGSPVRVQFEGWPAVQFVGWPSVALGTFGGEVVLVDPTDNGRGLFRILVAPKPDRVERRDGSVELIEWPGRRWLRQGVQVKGWVLLQQVPLWFELWRQMNGFPPALNAANGDANAAK